MKKALLSVLCLSLVLVMLFTLAACSKGPYGGTYYNSSKTQWFKLNGSKWTFYYEGEKASDGTFEVNEETGEIVFHYKEEGRELTMGTGTIKDGTLKVYGLGTFYLEGGKDSDAGDKGINANSLANAMSSAMAEYGWD